jgi:hypothetical protein
MPSNCVCCEQPTGDDDFTFTGDGYVIHKSCYDELAKEEVLRRRRALMPDYDKKPEEWLS